MTPTATFEQRCLELGLEIFERARQAEPKFWETAWWQQRAMDWLMGEQRLRTRLFQFVEVLPALSTNREIARHLREYLRRGDIRLPGAMELALGFDRDDSAWANVLAKATRRAALRMAAGFVAGSNVQEALDSIRRLRRGRMTFTLDVLGEATRTDAQADDYARRYVELIEAVGPQCRRWDVVPQIDCDGAGVMPRTNVSIKLTSLDPNFDPIDWQSSYDAIAQRLRPILRSARRHDAFVNIDMESFAYRDMTLWMFERLCTESEFDNMPDLGIVVQAYLQDSENDLRRLLDFAGRRGCPFGIRLVKGAYWDYETMQAVRNHTRIPVWTRKWESDACFERCARRLLAAHRLVRPALASHNVRSLAAGMAFAEALELTPRDFELQMLYGMGNPLKSAVAQMGYCLRVYTPYGDLVPGMAYLIRRLLENTSNDSFLRQSFGDRAAHERLLADPAVAQPPSQPVGQRHYVDPDEEIPMQAFQNVANTSFSAPGNRDKMTGALQYVRGEFGRTVPLVIGGKAVTTDKTFPAVNPARPSEVIAHICQAEPDHVDAAAESAAAAFPEWRATDVGQRARCLTRAAEIMADRRFELAALMVLEGGKPWRDADADVSEAIDYCNYYAEEALRMDARPRRRNLPGEENLYIYEPRGVAAVMSPWNFPLAIPTGMIAGALVTGNTVVFKPASRAAAAGAKLFEVFTAAGVPDGVLNLLAGPGEQVGAALTKHEKVAVVVFTGSRDVGLELIRTAHLNPGREHLKKVIADLGGKNAVLVDSDADLDEAVGGVVASAFGYSGQKCSACSRVIVHGDVHDRFVSVLAEAVKSVPVGYPEEPRTVVGPVIDDAARRRIEEYIQLGRKEGRVVLQSKPKVNGGGYFVGPTIIADVAPNAVIAQEEIFGPVLAVIRARDFDDALAIANGTSYALTGGVYSRSPVNIERAKREFHVGNLYINRRISGSVVDVQPYGGIKLSGMGSKAGGPDYLKQFCQPKTISENTLRHGFAPTETAESAHKH